MRNSKLFDDRPINTGRQIEFDIAKTGMLVELIFCHCFIECSSVERLAHGLPFIMDAVIGGPIGAPGFMAAMGLGMVYTRHNTPKDHAKRGIRLIIMSFALNICRYTIPYLIGYGITGNSEHYLSDIVYLTLENDIFMFAGLSFLLMALLIKLRVPDPGMVAIALAMSGLADIFNDMDLHNTPLNVVVGFFFGVHDQADKVRSYFTLFNWFLIPVFGYVYGQYYRRLKDKKRFHLMLGVPSVIFTVAFLAYRITTGTGTFAEGGSFLGDEMTYYHITTPDLICCVTGVISRFAICYLISLIVTEPVKRFSIEQSRNVTVIYCIQWVLISLSVGLVLFIATGTQELSDGKIILLSSGITVASMALAHYYNKFRLRHRSES
ncbi:MAG: DUF1624 domain-containing protein [Ruminococcus sp.]|nr:DUF1624 domain-containing protein [Ruminococcus sp.]